MAQAALNPYQEMLIAGAEADLASMRERFAAEAQKRASLPLGRFKVGFDSAYGMMAGGRLALAAEAGFAVRYDLGSDDDGEGTIVVEGRGEDDALERAKALFAGAVHVDPDESDYESGPYLSWDVTADLGETFWYEEGKRAPGEPLVKPDYRGAFSDDLDEPDVASDELIAALAGTSRQGAPEG